MTAGSGPVPPAGPPLPLDHVLGLLRCPRCAGDLVRQEQTVSCDRGHAFDLARQGYLNLLGRSSPRNADTAAMVAARERFLRCGHYSPLADRLRDTVEDAYPAPDGPARILEAGAGTGYYLSRLLDDSDRVGLALDVSTAASQRAARAHARMGAVVADVWGVLPVPDGAVDLVLSVFAPRHPVEFARVLRPAGQVLVLAPTSEHLMELRDPLGLLDVAEGKQDRLAGSLEGFAPVGGSGCRYRVSLDHDAVADLVAMGPNAFHTDPVRLRERIAALSDPVSVTVSVQVSAWRRPPG